MKSKVKSKYVEKMERIIAESRYADEFQQNKNHSKINIASSKNNAKNRKMLLENRVREGKWAQHFLETGVGDGSISICIDCHDFERDLEPMLRSMIERGKQAEIKLARKSRIKRVWDQILHVFLLFL